MKTATATVKAAVITAVAAVVVALIQYWPSHKAAPTETGQAIAGIVVDRDSNQGIGQAIIVVEGRPEQYVTEDSGNFRIEFHGGVPGSVRVRVTKPGFKVFDTSVSVPEENLTWPLIKQ